MNRALRPHIEVHVDELVLHGFAPGDARAIADTLERDLGQLLAARGIAVPTADASMDRIDAGSHARDGLAPAVDAAIRRAAGGER